MLVVLALVLAQPPAPVPTAAAAPIVGEDAPATLGTVERLDPAFDALVPPGAKIEVLAGGFKWAEGPVWVPAQKAVLFTDIPNNRVMKWSAQGGLSEYLKPSGFTGPAKFDGREPGANGLALDKIGNLILCQHGDRCIAQLNKDGKSFTKLADKHDGKRFNSPNDLVYHPNGDLYFTDPPYGLPKGMDDPAKEIAYQGVYRLKPDGTVTLLTKELSRPNGIAFSPDHKTLYVANSDGDRPIWMAFPVTDDGTLGAGKVFFDAMPMVKAKKPGGCDGLKVDVKGNLFATGPGGVLVFSPDGKHLGTLATGVPTANCGWGDDGRTLYITANDKLVRVKTSTKGLGF